MASCHAFLRCSSCSQIDHIVSAIVQFLLAGRLRSERPLPARRTFPLALAANDRFPPLLTFAAAQRGGSQPAVGLVDIRFNSGRAALLA